MWITLLNLLVLVLANADDSLHALSRAKGGSIGSALIFRTGHVPKPLSGRPFSQLVSRLAMKITCENSSIHVRFQVLTAASMKRRVLWDVAPCSLVGVDRRLRGAYCLHRQGHELIHLPDDGGSTPTRLHGAASEKTLNFSSNSC
jgi:hypothetical protein